MRALLDGLCLRKDKECRDGSLVRLGDWGHDTGAPGKPVKQRASFVLESPRPEAWGAILVPSRSLLKAFAGHSKALMFYCLPWNSGCR